MISNPPPGPVAVAQTIQTFLANLVTALTPTTQKAWGVAVQVYQVDALQHLLRNAVWVILVLLALYALGKFMRFRKEAIAEDRYNFFRPEDNFNESILQVLAWAWGVIFLLILVISVSNVIDLWYWVALVHPQLYAAHEVMRQLAHHLNAH